MLDFEFTTPTAMCIAKRYTVSQHHASPEQTLIESIIPPPPEQTHDAEDVILWIQTCIEGDGFANRFVL